MIQDLLRLEDEKYIHFNELQIHHVLVENISRYSDVQIVGEIIKNDINVKTVKPNWKKKNKPR